MAFGPSNVGNFYLTFFADSLVDCGSNFQAALRAVARWASVSAGCHSGNAWSAGNDCMQLTNRSHAAAAYTASIVDEQRVDQCPLYPEKLPRQSPTGASALGIGGNQ
jgi:hypothetical protein